MALLAAATLLAAALIGGALVAGSGLLRLTAVVPPIDAPPMPTPGPSAGPRMMGGWPETVAAPAGLYTWDPYGDHSWMHKVTDGPADSVELRFRLTTQPDELDALADALASYGDGAIPRPSHRDPRPGRPDMGGRGWRDRGAGRAWRTSGSDFRIIKTPQTYLMGIGGRVVTVEQGAPGQSAPPSSVIAKATQTWLMEMDGRVVAMDVTTGVDTTPALLAEAEATITVRARGSDPDGDPRLVFELTQGWDTG